MSSDPGRLSSAASASDTDAEVDSDAEDRESVAASDAASSPVATVDAAAPSAPAAAAPQLSARFDLLPPRRDAGLIAVWNRRVGRAMGAITAREMRQFAIDAQGSDDEGETAAQARTRTLLARLDTVLTEVNKDNIPHSIPVADGQELIDTVPAQSYTFFCVSVPRAAVNNRVAEICLDAIDGDPDLVRAHEYYVIGGICSSSYFFLTRVYFRCRRVSSSFGLYPCVASFAQFACIDEFPTSERNTWKSAGEGDDKIAIPPPHAVTTYYIGVFGYYQSKFKISFKLVYV